MEEIGYQIVHAIAGRMRIRAAWLETNPVAAGQLQRLMESLTYVTSVRINPLAQSIVVTYQVQTIATPDAEAQLIAAIQAVNPFPPPPVPDNPPDPAHSPVTPSPPVTVSQPHQTGSGLATPPAAIPDLPSPWDEPAPTVPLHSTASLAKRLNTTSQAITQRKAQLNFATWTQGQDPDGMAWCYEAESQSFRPVEAALEASEPSIAEAEREDQPSADHVDRLEKSGEIVGEVGGEAVGTAVGEAIGEIILGPVGALVGAELGAIVGEVIGTEMASATVTEIEHVAVVEPIVLTSVTGDLTPITEPVSGPVQPLLDTAEPTITTSPTTSPTTSHNDHGEEPTPAPDLPSKRQSARKPTSKSTPKAAKGRSTRQPRQQP